MAHKIRKLIKKHGNVSVKIEMIIDHTFPIDKKTLFRKGKSYTVDTVTAEYLVGGFYARKVQEKVAI